VRGERGALIRWENKIEEKEMMRPRWRGFGYF
jgi:hypothetical protein